MLEMGARGIGHIRYLTELTPPRIGLVLNVGTAHIGEFGGREQIAEAKGELVEALPSADEGGVAILNADDPLVRAMASRTKAQRDASSASPTKPTYAPRSPTHGQRTARLHASHTLRVQRRDHAPVR